MDKIKDDILEGLAEFLGVTAPRLRGWIGASLALTWLLAFGVEVHFIFRQASRLAWMNDRLESAAASLEEKSKDMISSAQEMSSISKDLDSFRGILNFLPQDPGFVRTQKAILEEVEVLRRKLSGRLKGKLYIVIDTKVNKFYLKQGMTLLLKADCSVGRGGRLLDRQTGQRWEFVTPQGEFRVLGKIENPVWTKPDWAFVEAKEPVPPPGDPSRGVPGELGKYVLNLGDGYLIHGTKNEKLLGRPASHGCVRLGALDLEKVYQTVPIGTKVYIY